MTMYDCTTWLARERRAAAAAGCHYVARFVRDGEDTSSCQSAIFLHLHEAFLTSSWRETFTVLSTPSDEYKPIT